MLDGGLVDQLIAQSRRVAREAARLLSLAVRVADAAPAAEFGVDEVAFALAWTRQAALAHDQLGRQLITGLPDVFAALASGDIDLPKARVFADALACLDTDTARSVAAQVLPVAGEKTTAQIRDRLHRRALAADPDAAAKRRRRGEADRRVVLDPCADGTAALTALGLPALRAAAAMERVNAIARARRRAGETLTMDQLRADTVLDLLEGVGPYAMPGVRRGVIELIVGLDTLALLNSQPAVLAGYGPVAADIARQWTAANPDYQWRFSIRDETTGELLFQGLTNTRPGPIPTGPGPGPQPGGPAKRRRTNDNSRPPAPSRPTSPEPKASNGGGFRPRPRPPAQDPAARFPNAAMVRWIRSRDQTCRAPGCRVPASACDIDHTIPVAHGGRTVHHKLGPACRHHHRLRHEGGWQLHQPEPGVFIWTSPAGRIYKVGPEPP